MIYRIFVDLLDGLYRTVGSFEIEARSLQSPAEPVGIVLRTAPNKLSGVSPDLECGCDRERCYEHYSRHAARELYSNRLSRRLILLQLAVNAWLTHHRSDHSGSYRAVRIVAKKTCSGNFRRQQTAY